jgi:predicted ATPase
MIERKIAQLSEDDRKLLTAASVQGYEFDSAVVAQALNLEADEVEERLEKLERVFAFVKLTSEGEFPNRTLTLKYRFIHVLYQNALYNSLRATRKATLSRAVAQVLESFYGERTTSVASELAALWEAAREYARAAEYFLKAAGNATQINAHREAVQLARRGLETLQRAPESPEYAQLELGLQLRLGLSLTPVHGWTSPEGDQCFARAHTLCQQAGNDPRLFAALRGIWAKHVLRGEYHTARPLADQLLQIAEQAGDPALLASACYGEALTVYSLGELSAAREYCERALALYDPARYKSYLAFSTQDLGVQARSILAYCLLALGFPERALQQVEESLALAERLSHPHSLGAALFGLGAVWFRRREWVASQRSAERILALSQENDLGDYLSWATLLHNLAQGFDGQPEAKIDQARQSLDVVRAKGLEFAMPYWLAHLAELSGLAGQIAAGLDTTAVALTQIERTGERFWEAEVWRIKGDLLLQTDNHPQAEAEDCYHKAIEVAQRQSAKSLELRATGGSRRLLPQGHRGCTEAERKIAGTACDDESRALVAPAGQARRSATDARGDLRLVHRRLWHGGFAGGEGVAGRVASLSLALHTDLLRYFRDTPDGRLLSLHGFQC